MCKTRGSVHSTKTENERVRETEGRGKKRERKKTEKRECIQLFTHSLGTARLPPHLL